MSAHDISSIGHNLTLRNPSQGWSMTYGIRKTRVRSTMDFVPRHHFDACVRRYGGDRRPRGFSCRDQFLCLAFAQLTFRESLRDIETCLRAVEPKLYHAGFRGKIARSTLADANRTHDWRIFADFAQVLIGRARKLSAEEPFGVDLEQTVYALDSTTIDLCLSLFPWAQFRRRKGAVKLHTLLDLRGNIPRAYAPLFQGLRTTFSCVFEGFSRELSGHYIIHTNCNALYSPIHYRKVANM